jgi:nitrogenase molybdenum-iron protein NifN
MARVVATSRPVVTDPLKHSQPLGGLLALLGLARCMPLLHGAQGCGAFAKSLLTRHFREPIPVTTTGLTEVSSVLGATGSLLSGLDRVASDQHPDVIGVLTTGVTEVSGEDVDATLRSRVEQPLVITAQTPDFIGGLSDGWSSVLTALVTAEVGGTGPAEPDLVAALCGVSLTAADAEELTDLVSAFGLRPTVVPDLSRSLDGHLAAGWSPVTTGGTTLAELGKLATTAHVVSVGTSAARAGRALAVRAATGHTHIPHCGGLVATDALVSALVEISDRDPGPRLRQWRERLTDGLLDSHFVLGGARVALAGEPERLATVAAVLSEAGARVVAAVAPTPDPVLEQLPCDEVVIGDFSDLEERAAEAGAELVVASSHARALSCRINAAHLTEGFPVVDRLGPQLLGSIGYRGSLRLLFAAGNQLLEHRRHEC